MRRWTNQILATAIVGLVSAMVAPARAHFLWTDAQAYALLEAAHNNRQTLPKEFPGSSADVVLNDNGAVAEGKATYTPDKGVDLQIQGASEEATQWLRRQLGSAIGHRRGGDFAKGDGRHAITFGPDDRSPLGQLVSLNDDFQSSYRVQDNQITEVTRTMGDQRFTITIIETTRTSSGKYLPRHFVVTYFDAKSGHLQRTEIFTDTYASVEGVWLPASRRVITARDGQLTVRVLELRNVRLLTRGREVAR